MKQGIFNNDITQKHEVWRNGKVIGKISYACADETKKIWRERYLSYIK